MTVALCVAFFVGAVIFGGGSLIRHNSPEVGKIAAVAVGCFVAGMTCLWLLSN